MEGQEIHAAAALLTLAVIPLVDDARYLFSRAGELPFEVVNAGLRFGELLQIRTLSAFLYAIHFHLAITFFHKAGPRLAIAVE